MEDFDPLNELKTKKDIYELLKPLSKQEQIRVWRWVGEVLELYSGSVMRLAGGPTGQSEKARVTNQEIDWGSFSSAAEVLGAGNAAKDNERVLLVAAFLQEKHQKNDLTGKEISDELKHVGHRLTNVTMTIGTLVNRKPSWMIQTRKEGRSQQARKKYKVTTEGLKQALALLTGSGSGGSEAVA